MVAWWDRWLRGRDAEAHRDVVDVFVRRSTRPAPDLDLHDGHWVRDTWPSAATSWEEVALAGPRSLDVRPDVGTAAWIDCAGHLPWGQSADQRDDDARSLTWDVPGDARMLVGQPRVRLRVSASTPAASMSVKLCDVFPDGTSALVCRGTLDLAFRDGLHAPAAAAPLTPGEVYDVEVTLDACAYELAPGQTLRVSVAGSDWPNTVAPPGPVRLTVHEATLVLPRWSGSNQPSPPLVPGAEHSSESAEGVTWVVTDDVLQRTTECRVASGSEYAVPHSGAATEAYSGTVTVDRRTFAQRAAADCTFRLLWPEAQVRVHAGMTVDVTAEAYDVRIEVDAHEGPSGAETEVARRTWHERLLR